MPGFGAVEFLFPYEHPPEAIAERLTRNGLTQALFNLPPGDFAAGERGLAALPERFDELKAGVDTALRYAEATGVARLHLMAGLADPNDPSRARRLSPRRGLDGRAAGAAGLDLVLEPINGRNMPGYFLNDFGMAADADPRPRAAEPEAAVRPLPLPDPAWRRDHAAARPDADRRPRADRLGARAQRARHRRDGRRLPVRRARPARLRRLRRLRVQPGRRYGGGVRLVRALPRRPAECRR